MKTQNKYSKIETNLLFLLIVFMVLSTAFTVVLCYNGNLSAHAESTTAETDFVQAPNYEFYLDEMSLSSMAITTTSDGVSYVEEGESIASTPVISVRFAEELDPDASVRAVIGEDSFVNVGKTVTMGEYSGKVEISLFYIYKGIESEMPARTIYLGLKKLVDNVYMISGDWSMGDLPNVKNVFMSAEYEGGERSGVISEAQLVVIGCDSIQFNLCASAPGFNNGAVKYNDTPRGIFTSYVEKNIIETNFTKILLEFDNSEANFLNFEYIKNSTTDVVEGNYRAYIQLKTKKMTVPEEYKWNVRVNNLVQEISVSADKTIEFDYFDENDFTFTVPVLGLDETCTVYRSSGSTEEAGKKMEIEQGLFYYHWGVIDSDYSFRFKYVADGYLDYDFIVNVKLNVGDRTPEDILVKESTSPIEIINDETYPFAFNSTISTAETQFFVAGNGTINNSMTYLGIKMHNIGASKASGMLYFDYYIDCYTGGSHTDAAFWSIGEKVTSTDGTPTVLSESDTNCGYLKSGELKSYKDSQDKTESLGMLRRTLSAYIPITFEEGETEKIFYLAYFKDAINAFGYTDVFGVANIRFYAGEATITYAVSNSNWDNNVTLTVDGVDKNSGELLYKGNEAELTVAEADGYKFYGWVEDGEYVSSETSLSFRVGGDRNLTAVIEPVGAYHARIKGAFYATTAEAIAAAQVGDWITLIENDTISADVTLKEGVTLLLPYSITDTTGKLIGNASNAGINVSWTDENSISKYKYLTLTVDNGAELNILGALIVGAVQHHPSQYAQGHTSGAYSSIVNNGNIYIKAGGVLYNYGLIEGSGKLHSENGAYLYTPFIVNNFSGGSNTSNLYDANQFPFTQFATINITCEQRVDYGATVMGMTSLYFWGSVTTQDVCLIGKIEDSTSDIGSLIWLEKGSYLEIGYDIKSIEKVKIDSSNSLSLKDSGVTTIEVYGNITAGSFSLQGFGSKRMVLAIPYTYNFVLRSGASVDILADYAYKIMPGAVVTVEDGAVINIAEGGALYVYDGLIQGPKSGKRYPSAAELNENGFAQSGMLILDGTLNINGLFAGIVQSTSNKGIINTASSASLSNITVKEGSSGYYMDDCAEFIMDACVNTLRGIISLQPGKSYKAFATGSFVLETFSMVSASGIAENELSVQLNQSMSGVFAEYNPDRKTYIWDIEVYIGEAVANVSINIDGNNYITDEIGKISLTVDYGTTLTYYTYGFETAGSRTFTIGVGFEYTLTDIISGVTVASDNVYRRVYNADGDVVQDFQLNAVISYFGGSSETIELKYQDNLSKYVNQVTIFSDIVSNTFSEKLYVAPREFAVYQLLAEAIGNSESIPQAATEAYESYVSLLATRDSDEIEYAMDYLSDSTDYLDVIVSISVASVTYGDESAEAIITTVNGLKSNVSAQLVGYTVSDSVAGAFFWSGEYASKEYTVVCNATLVVGKQITVTVVAKTSVYGDDIQALEAVIGANVLVGDDDKDDVFSLAKQPGDTVGSYDIVVQRLHAGYVLAVVDDQDAYTITQRDITLTVNNHADVMLQSAMQGMSIGISANIGNCVNVQAPMLTYNIYKNGDELVTTMNAAFVLSAALPIGEYTVEAVTDDINFNVVSSQKGSLKIVANNDSYTVTVRYYIIDSEYITAHVYDGNQINVEISVTIGDSEEAILPSEFSYAVKKSGSDAEIKDYGTYTVNVTVGNVVYNNASSITVEKRELVLSWQNLSFIYDGTAVKPEVSATNIIGEENVVLSVSGEQINFGANYTAQALLSGEDCGNYKLPTISTTAFSILKRAITVTVEKASSIYGNALATLSATATNLATDSIDSIVELGFGDATVKDKGSYDVVVTCINDNYTVTSKDTKDAYTVTARQISIVPDNKEAFYGDAEVTLTATVAKGSSLANEEDIYDVISLSRAEGIIVGDYNIDVKCVDENYTVTASTATYKIKPLSVTITVGNATSVYGDELVPATLSIDGNTGYKETAGDIISVEYSLVDTLKAGKYNMTAAKKSDNYTVTIKYSAVDHSVYTVSKRKVTITAGATANLVTGEGDEHITFDNVKDVLTVITSNLLEKDKVGFESSIELFVKIGGVELLPANFEDIICGGDHVISARYAADNNYDVTVSEGTLSITRPYVYTQVVKTTFTYTGDVIKAFDYTTDIVGYLKSATESTFEAIYYRKGDPTKTSVELINAGEYVMQIKIVHDSAYLWKDDAVKEYNITINKKDISDKIVVNGIKHGGYVIMSGKLNAFASFAEDYDDYDIQIIEALSNLTGNIEGDKEGYMLTSPGTYTFSAEVVDNNYCGKQVIVFDVYEVEMVEIATQFVAKQKEFASQPNSKQLFELRELNNRLTEAQRGALIGSDEEFKEAYEAYCAAWEQEVEAVNSDFDIAKKAYSQMAIAFAVATVTTLGAAIFVLLKGRICR